MSRVIVTDIDVQTARQRYSIHHLTDIHRGSRHHDAASFERRVAEIAKDPNARWICGGDVGDLITPKDPRFAGDMLAPDYLSHQHRLPDYFLEDMEAVLQPIAGKCLFFGIGNHETAVSSHYHRGVGEELACRLGIPEKFGGYRGWAPVRFHYGTRRQSVRLFQYHGWASGRTKGRKALEAERNLGAQDADAFFLGHDHQPYDDIWQTETLTSARGKYRVELRPRAVINGGCWLGADHANQEPLDPKRLSDAVDPSWASKFNFRPERVGGPILHLDLDFSTAHPTKIDFVVETRSNG